MVPEGPLRIARPFTGGMCEPLSRAVGTIEPGPRVCRAEFRRPSGTRLLALCCNPALETPGYFHTSLRDGLRGVLLDIF